MCRGHPRSADVADILKMTNADYGLFKNSELNIQRLDTLVTRTKLLTCNQASIWHFEVLTKKRDNKGDHWALLKNKPKRVFG